MLLYSFIGCEKDDPQISTHTDIAVLLSFSFDGASLQFDDIKYTNAAGNNLSITRLQFYLSNFEVENSTGVLYNFDDVIYVDAENSTNTSFALTNIPIGNYKRIKFLIGLDSIHNMENALPHTVENDNMVWPAPMGGGYHFLKMEGNFLDQSVPYGYAMHLGMNNNYVKINLINDFEISSNSNTIDLEMNINEWFQTPYVYDFNVDGNYSMGDSIAMAKLLQNGNDVFTIN
jgi:hypothetical protein